MRSLAALAVAITVLGVTAMVSGAQAQPSPTETLAARLTAIRGEAGAEALVGPTLEHAERALERARSLAAGDPGAARRAARICDAALTLAERQLGRARSQAAAAAAERRAGEAEARARGARRALETTQARIASTDAPSPDAPEAR